ncbi:MAG TPA: hypothetical protein VM425_12320 [Myxococcota bacterium]|nr:hypothetical protein [Myxococcota bacterium]
MNRKFGMRHGVALLALLLMGALAMGCEATRQRRQQEREFKAQIETYNKQVKNPLDKVVCKKIALTGSRIPKRVCKTRGEWAKIRSEGQRAIEKLRPADRKSD